MTHLKPIYQCFLAAVLLTGCTSDSDSYNAVNRGFLKVSGSIASKSRAVSSSWEAGDRIGVSGNGYNNIPYSTPAGDGGFTADNQDEAIKVTPGETERFTAYYPYSADAPYISFNVADADGRYTDNSGRTDFLRAENATEDDAVNFSFTHAMTALRLTLEVVCTDSEGNEVSRPDNMAEITEIPATLSPVMTEGIFNTGSGEVTATGEARFLGCDISSEGTLLTLPPVNLEQQLTVTALFGHRQLQAVIKPALRQGYCYSYTLRFTVNADDYTLASGTLAVSQVSISPRTEIDCGNADFVEIDPSDPAWRPDDGGQTVKPVNVSAGDFLLTDGRVLPASTTLDASIRQNIAAVVFYVARGEELHDLGFPHGGGLALALENAAEDMKLCDYPGMTVAYLNRFSSDETLWSDFAPYFASVYIGGTDTPPFGMHGYACTEAMKFIASNGYYSSPTSDRPVTNISATGLTTALGNVSNISAEGVSSWHLPSYQEFMAIERNYDIILESITRAGGNFGFYDNVNHGFYWTSDQRDEHRQWIWIKGAPQYTEKTNSHLGNFRLAVSFRIPKQ